MTAMWAFLGHFHCRGSGLLSVKLPVPLFTLSGGPALDTRRTKPACKQHAAMPGCIAPAKGCAHTPSMQATAFRNSRAKLDDAGTQKWLAYA